MPRTWELHNVTGRAGFEDGWMDLTWEGGAPVELTNPAAVLNQRVQKATVEARGSNLFEPRWGSDFGHRLGTKLMGEATLQDIGSALSVMVASLAAMDREDAGRLGLKPDEQLVGVQKMRLVTNGTDISIEAWMVTGVGITLVVVR